MPNDTRMTAKKLKEYYQNHKDKILWGTKVLQDEELKRKIQMAIVTKVYDDYKKKVLYEEALDYASK